MCLFYPTVLFNSGKKVWNVELSEVKCDSLAMKSRGWEGVGSENALSYLVYNTQQHTSSTTT